MNFKDITETGKVNPGGDGTYVNPEMKPGECDIRQQNSLIKQESVLDNRNTQKTDSGQEKSHVPTLRKPPPSLATNPFTAMSKISKQSNSSTTPNSAENSSPTPSDSEMSSSPNSKNSLPILPGSIVSSSSNSKNSLPILLLPPELFTFTFSEEVKKSSLLAPSLQNNQMLIPTPSGNTHIPVDSDDKDIEFIDVPLEIGENGGGNTVKLAYANLTDDGVMEAFKTEVEANKKGANKKKGESKNKSGDFTLNVDKVEFKVGLMKDKNTNVTITFGGKNVSAFVWNKGKGCQENRVADKIKKFVDGEKFKNSTVDLAKSYNPVTSDNVKNFCEDLSSTLLLLKNLPISSGVKLYLNLNSNFLLEITVTRKGEIYVLYFRAVNRTELTTTTNEMPDGKHKIICGFPISALETVMERKIKEVMADAGKKALDEEETQNNQPDDRDPDGPKDQDKKSNMSYSLSSVNSTDVGSSDSHENDDHLLNFLRLINEHDLRLMNEHEENNSQSSEKNNDDISSQSSEFSNHYSNYVKGQKEGDGVQDNISKDYSTTKSTTESDRDSTPTPPKGRKIYDSESDDD